MKPYVDGFVLPVPKKNRAAYARMARLGAKVMKDPRLAQYMDPRKMPLDGKRMFWGGFRTVVNR